MDARLPQGSVNDGKIQQVKFLWVYLASIILVQHVKQLKIYIYSVNLPYIKVHFAM